jgi:hypothetical protein
MALVFRRAASASPQTHQRRGRFHRKPTVRQVDDHAHPAQLDGDTRGPRSVTHRRFGLSGAGRDDRQDDPAAACRKCF